MSNGLFYSLGKFISKNKAASTAIAAAAVVGVPLYSTVATQLFASSTQPPAKAPQALAPVPVKQVTPPQPDPLIAKCAAGLEQMMVSAKELMRKNEPLAAVNALQECRDHFTDPRAKDLYVKAGDAMSIQAAKRADQEAAALKKQKKRSGVTLGMDQQDVLDSSWGKPNKVNRTTNARGVSEQWVYDGGYLYFDDGVLTSIQN